MVIIISSFNRMSRKEVDSFIRELKEIVCDTNFNIDTDFFLNTGKEKNMQTLSDLDYGAEEVLEILSGLTVSHGNCFF